MDVCSRCGSLLAPTRVPAPAAAALAGHPALQAHDAAGARSMHGHEHRALQDTFSAFAEGFLNERNTEASAFSAAGRGSGAKMQCRMCGGTKEIDRVALPYVFRCNPPSTQPARDVNISIWWCHHPGSPNRCASTVQVPHGRACGHEHQVLPQDGWGMTCLHHQHDRNRKCDHRSSSGQQMLVLHSAHVTNGGKLVSACLPCAGRSSSRSQHGSSWPGYPLVRLTGLQCNLQCSFGQAQL